MTQRDLFPTTISSQPDIHVSRSQLQDGKKEKKMTATSGRTSLELLHAKDPLGAFSKTFMVTLPWVSTKCSLTWKVKATPQGRLLFQLAVKTHPIAETDSGLLHTPTAKANQMSPSMKERDKGSWGKEPPLWPTPRVGGEEGMETLAKRKGVRKAMQHNLTASVEYHQDPTLWPTPRVSDTEGAVVKNVEMNNGSFSRVNKKGVRWGVKLKDAVHHMEKMWPTPTANEDAAGTPKGKMQKMLGNHPEVRGKTPEEWKSGQLNPTWVEWLMGYPGGWTDLKD